MKTRHVNWVLCPISKHSAIGEKRLTLRRKTSVLPHSCRRQSPSEEECEELGSPWEAKVREGWGWGGGGEREMDGKSSKEEQMT